MKDFFKTSFPPNGKKLSLAGISEEQKKTSQKISCLPAVTSSFFENCFPPNSSNGFHEQKNSSDQKTLFPLDRKSGSTSCMKDLLKNAFPP